jgi:hypothetical protein
MKARDIRKKYEAQIHIKEALDRDREKIKFEAEMTRFYSEIEAAAKKGNSYLEFSCYECLSHHCKELQNNGYKITILAWDSIGVSW